MFTTVDHFTVARILRCRNVYASPLSPGTTMLFANPQTVALKLRSCPGHRYRFNRATSVNEPLRQAQTGGVAGEDRIRNSYQR